MKYYVWIPLLFTLDMALFLAYSSEPWQWYYNGLIPLDVYQTGITVINYVFMAICFVAALCSIGQWCYYYCQYSTRPDGQVYKLLQCLSCGQNMHKPKPLTRPVLPTDSSIRATRASVALENGESEQPSTSEIKKSAGGFFQNDVSPMPVTPEKQSSSTVTTTI
uniref:Uncharacterized protein n=1 Tax=Panagrolaimus superbus TaxID=310955 RepID=A0A914YLI5_9BILA